MKPTLTIAVTIDDIKFEVSLDTFDPHEPYVDGVWLPGSIQELSDVLDPKVFERIEQKAIRIAIEDAAISRMEGAEAWS
jgi:hypothetical protein